MLPPSEKHNLPSTKPKPPFNLGTVKTTALAEARFANWGPACRVLVDGVSEWFSVFFLLYRHLPEVVRVLLATDAGYGAQQRCYRGISKRNC